MDTLNYKLKYAVSDQDVNDVRALLNAGADANSWSRDGGLRLLLALLVDVFNKGGEDKALEIAKLLLVHGADVNAMTRDRLTPLHIAALYDLKDIAELLLQNNADIDAKDYEGMTPLQIAERRKYGSHVDVLISAYQKHRAAKRRAAAEVPVNSSSTQKREPNPGASISPSLVCASCGKIYKIGDDAVAVSMEYGFELAAGVIRLGDGQPLKREDLVSTLDGLSSDSIQAARDRARPSWEIIRKSLARGDTRSWCCKGCDAINSYPLNLVGIM